MDRPQRDRTEGPHLRLLDATADDGASEASAGLALIVRDLARALEAEMALLMVPDDGLENVEMLAAWGGAASDGGLPSPVMAGGFVGRALHFERAAVEPIAPDDDSIGKAKSGAEMPLAIAAPVTPLIGPRGVLIAAFSRDPLPDVPAALWLAESYARLASLCLHDRDALDGLLSGSRRDGLTGCLTQTAFLAEFRRELARAERHHRPLSCSFIDLDHFKRVNERYGHLHGSRVLASIAAVLRAGIRDEDTVGRYGGDEFVLSLPDTDEAAAIELSRRLRATITATMINLPHDPIDASIGVAQWHPGSTVQTLLEDADQALLAAKAVGGATTIGASALSGATAPRDAFPRPGPGPRAVRPSTGTASGASVNDVLAVSAQFEQSGGASIELTAWELETELAHVVSAWSHAIEQGLLEPAGTDKASGEEMWRLSDQGRRALTSSPRPEQSPISRPERVP
ncbi:MAG TPA: GGDEF domain-containing protein [Solirubrobacteraceae bacterium]|jgi:diguanylate cyclase (GGDEF)-like protein|nr:GGDEF domain-containing protein [Solirubrobacteraceae bacterium]